MAGLVPISQLSSLHQRMLRMTRIDDAGLKELHRRCLALEIVSDNYHFLHSPRTKCNRPKVIKPEGKNPE